MALHITQEHNKNNTQKRLKSTCNQVALRCWTSQQQPCVKFGNHLTPCKISVKTPYIVVPTRFPVAIPHTHKRPTKASSLLTEWAWQECFSGGIEFEMPFPYWLFGWGRIYEKYHFFFDLSFFFIGTLFSCVILLFLSFALFRLDQGGKGRVGKGTDFLLFFHIVTMDFFHLQ